MYKNIRTPSVLHRTLEADSCCGVELWLRCYGYGDYHDPHDSCG